MVKNFPNKMQKRGGRRVLFKKKEETIEEKTVIASNWVRQKFGNRTRVIPNVSVCSFQDKQNINVFNKPKVTAIFDENRKAPIAFFIEGKKALIAHEDVPKIVDEIKNSGNGNTEE